MTPPPPQSPLFPYTTLFRSRHPGRENTPRADDVVDVITGTDDEATPAVGHGQCPFGRARLTTGGHPAADRKSTRLNSSHVAISSAVFCLKKKESALTSKVSK